MTTHICEYCNYAIPGAAELIQERNEARELVRKLAEALDIISYKDHYRYCDFRYTGEDCNCHVGISVKALADLPEWVKKEG